MTKQHDADMAAFAERFNKLLDTAGVSPKGKGRQAEVAKKINLSTGGARKLLEAEAEPSYSTQRAIFQWLRSEGVAVNLNWLVTGEGEMLVGKKDAIQHQSAIDHALLEEVIKQARDELKRAGGGIDAEREAKLVALVYDTSIVKGEVNQSFLQQMVRLMT